MASIGTAARINAMPPSIISDKRLMNLALPASGVTGTKIAGVLPISSSSPTCDDKAIDDGT